ncbi:ABC transporter permease [Paenibacillus sp. YYML68]|uniref:fluoroquinolone export ABC transporter permease subunit n=1 Tax=Paenibacillus sp. YYML68 TaxID=2909250 RepID=UPI0024909DAE|nr:ABC transporter permease [Paenibacillus sp. YYML68]
MRQQMMKTSRSWGLLWSWRRWMNGFRQDISFQWRHRFYHAYMFVCAAYYLLMLWIPEAYREKTAVVLTFSDPSALGLLFAGGIVLLERQQRLLDCFFITPYRVTEYVLSKGASLGLLSLVVAFLIHGFAAGLPDAPIHFALGVLLTSLFFTWLGIGLALRCRSLNGYLLYSQAWTLVFVLPLLGYLGVLQQAWLALIPTDGTFILLEADEAHVTWVELARSYGLWLAADAGALLFASRMLKLTIQGKIGGGLNG